MSSTYQDLKDLKTIEFMHADFNDHFLLTCGAAFALGSVMSLW